MLSCHVRADGKHHFVLWYRLNGNSDVMVFLCDACEVSEPISDLRFWGPFAFPDYYRKDRFPKGPVPALFADIYRPMF